MFSYKDIQWVRNVKREGGKNWAYFDEDKDEMILHWSSSFVKKPTPAMIPQIGDIVVLYQKLNTDNQFYFTHLLTPIDSIERDFVKTNPKHRWGRKMKVLAKTQEIIRPQLFELGRVNQGHTYNIEYLNLNVSKEEIQKLIWNEFLPYFRVDISNDYETEIIENYSDDALDNFEAAEGKYKEVLHKLRERDRTLVNKKKVSTNPLVCECCTFDFSKKYSDLGNGFIECHHIIPINKGERITRLEHLALVCSNCHRMLHRKNKNNDYYTVEELKDIIKKNNE
ncbi:MAG TPA: HNH endonuclease [Flavobacterium sp.]|uniref:HNH endonuclease n=1 Tax=Flavobacterium sp. TaxID=239 RepID=UPI002DB7D951|nr:HNH endonuclease [Flavobacterium sp.]HEU4790281.1 HNH endonuclease [Flavobacterium sp.]